MTYLIATFRSRSATTSAYNRLIERGVNCAITSTPQAANVGCGLSIKFLPQDKNIVAATAKSYSSFSGFFLRFFPFAELRWVIFISHPSKS